jgi:PAS domain S-box-containing protein
MTTISLTGREAFFPENEIIVSKTDLVGRMTYVNQTFCRVAGYRESELLGQPHSIIRHPDMPRAVFKLLWDTITAGKEIFAYVKNKAKDGDFYWVFAHVTPSLDKQKNIIAFHSNRRVPSRAAIDKVIIPLYRATLAEEARHKNGKASLAAGVEFLTHQLTALGVSYDEFILTL